jgi:hypothetical protein
MKSAVLNGFAWGVWCQQIKPTHLLLYGFAWRPLRMKSVVRCYVTSVIRAITFTYIFKRPLSPPNAHASHFLFMPTALSQVQPPLPAHVYRNWHAGQGRHNDWQCLPCNMTCSHSCVGCVMSVQTNALAGRTKWRWRIGWWRSSYFSFPLWGPPQSHTRIK